MMARWKSRHFTVVTALAPRKVDLGHSKVVVSWLLHTPARRDCIHRFLFLDLIARKISSQLGKICFCNECPENCMTRMHL